MVIPVKPINEIEVKSEVSVNDKILICDSETEEARLASKDELKGDKGDKGDTGETGPQGPQGIQGIQGVQGLPGNDGYSPSATVTQEGKVTTITITDEQGTTSKNIDLNGYATSEEVEEGLEEKQGILEAGDNIEINGNTISATDTKYTAGEGIAIDENNVISNTQTSAEWGNIEGDIEDQLDLQKALEKKQDKLTAGTDLEIIEGGEITEEISGHGSITLTNAVEDGLNSLTLYGNCIQSVLPSEYTRLDYIQSTGTQYIDTGITANFANNKIKQTAVVEFTTSSSTRELMGTNGYGFWGKSATDKIEAALGSVTVSDSALTKNVINWTTDPTDSNRLTLNVNSNQYKSTASSFVDADYAYYVFALGIRVGSGADASFLCKAKVYSYAIAKDDEVVCDLIPCQRNSDSALGMYDLVRGVFLTNAGTGTFTAGNKYSVLNPDNPMPIISNNGELSFIPSIADFSSGLIKRSTNTVTTMTGTKDSITYTFGGSSGYVGKVFPVTIGKTYTVSYNELTTTSTTNSARVRFVELDSNITVIDNNYGVDITSPYTFVATKSYVGLWICYPYTVTNDITIGVNGFSLAEGSQPVGLYVNGLTETVTDEEGNTATAEMLLSIGDYTDTQEVLSGEITRKVGVIALNGTESWDASPTANNYCLAVSDALVPTSNIELISTHYVGTSLGASVAPNNSIKLAVNTLVPDTGLIYIKQEGFASVDDFKIYLTNQYASGTPVIVVYPLATETTESVTGQTLTTIEGDNTLTITQASIDNLPIEANYTAIGGDIINFTNETGYITSADLKTVGGENLVGSGDIKAVINTATGTDSLTVFGNPSSATYNINIGATSASSSSGYSVAIGNYARATGTSSIALGRGAGAGGVSGVAIGRDSSAGQENSIAIGRSAIASGTNSIQIGKGSTTAAKKLNVGFDTDNYELLDGATGLIPDARISTNIQRTANMVTTLSGADNDHYPTAKAVSDAIQSSGGGDMLASTYDPNNIGADAFDYTNFTNTPTIPSKTSDLNNDSGFITSSALPTKVSDLTNDSGFITGISGSDVTSALGYTPYNSTNPAGYVTSSYHDSTKQDTISDLATIRSGASAGATAVQPADVLTKTNTTAYTPTGDYNPATKKYVDDAVSGVGGIQNDTTGTTSTITGIWAGSESEFTALSTKSGTGLYFVF